MNSDTMVTPRWTRVRSLVDVEWPEDAVLVCDEAVISWAPAALRTRCVVVQAGESLKRLAAIEALAERVLELRATRPLTLVAMGGGSVGDAVGFLASVLWRGVDLWHVPTTLLAAVDSAHGGKTAVNLGKAKNQLGTFWAAARTVIADDILAALPARQRREGLTELVKALWIGDADALDRLDAIGIGELAAAPWGDVEGVVGELLDAAIRVKHDIVDRDPRETAGIRTWLNLGHTAAHALELECGVSHGVAVAWGIACAGTISRDRGILDEADYRRLCRHLHPLMGDVPVEPSRCAFEDALRRDKKAVDANLRAVLLRGPGRPLVVDDFAVEGWFEALAAVRRTVFDATVRIDLRRARPATLWMSASKSELNRALVIAALRGEEAAFALDSDADDVRAMRAGIASLRGGELADAKNGGTTFRFLSAIAVSCPNGGRIRVGAQLAARPQAALYEAWSSLGVAVAVEQVEDGAIVEFGPLPEGPVSARVDASLSSQFASAIALLRATRPVTLHVDDVASPGYLRMTERMVEMSPLEVTADASSAAMWHVLGRLGLDVTLANAPSEMQPDAVLPQLLWEADATGEVTLSLANCPDLVCVLAAYAALTPPAVTLSGAPQLRHKESNRIDDLVAAFGEVGVEVEPLPDGVRIRAGVQTPLGGRTFDPRDDHRLAFAAIVLASRAALLLKSPRCVTKSYPAVFADARLAGFRVEVELESRQ